MSIKEELLTHIQSQLLVAAGTANRNQSTDSYTGSTHTFYAVPVPVRRQILKQLVRVHTRVSDQEWLELADALFRGESHEEKTMGGMVLRYRPTTRSSVTFHQLKQWLEELVGWAEVDTFCYNIFTFDELLADWGHWRQFLHTCARSRNVNVRRAALVFLCGPVERSADSRLHDCALALAESLQSERTILITKAISWLLRCQATTNRQLVKDYIASNQTALPRFVVREVTRKLETGKKNR